MHYKNMNSYGHPTGTEAVKKFNEEANIQLKVEPKKDFNQTKNKME